MKKGFTLVELLAVIVILSVIAIITVPIIGNVIEESKKKALEQSAYGLVSAADYYALEHEGEYSFIFDNNHKGENIDKTRQLEYKGSIEGEGKLYIDNNGKVSLCINTDKYYVIKNYDSGIVIGNISDKGECNVRKIGNHYVAYLENEGVGDYITSSDLALYALKTDLNNYVTNEDLQDSFDLKLGTETLTTTSQTINGSINELNEKIKIISTTSATQAGVEQKIYSDNSLLGNYIIVGYSFLYNNIWADWNTSNVSYVAIKADGIYMIMENGSGCLNLPIKIVLAKI